MRKGHLGRRPEKRQWGQEEMDVRDILMVGKAQRGEAGEKTEPHSCHVKKQAGEWNQPG